MEVISVKQKTNIVIDDYQFANPLKEEVLSLLKVCNPIPQDDSNVKASIHTEWDWEPNNLKLTNLKKYIGSVIINEFTIGKLSAMNRRNPLVVKNFWANVYSKGDFAHPHDHIPFDWSFAYFVQARPNHAPFVFTESGKKIRPKEGRFVAFPSHLKHHVPEHKCEMQRITLSGNMLVALSF
tara:strand:+ start:92 stop:634 length:543 start_codon:yes stop_codon:yes gene_type:complete